MTKQDWERLAEIAEACRETATVGSMMEHGDYDRITYIDADKFIAALRKETDKDSEAAQ